MKIVKIGAMWCPGCIIMQKVWNKLSENYELDITSLYLDMDSEEVEPQCWWALQSRENADQALSVHSCRMRSVCNRAGAFLQSFPHSRMLHGSWWCGLLLEFA